MKYWLMLTALIIANVIAWAIFSDDIQTEEPRIDVSELSLTETSASTNAPFEVVNPENVKLLSDKVHDNNACVIVGPLTNDIVATQLQTQLTTEETVNLTFDKISEANQDINGYRVYIGPLELEDIPMIELKLKDVGIEESHAYELEKVDETGAKAKEHFLSLVVYGYLPSAQKYSQQLNNIGFESKIQRYSVSSANRYWLKSSIEVSQENVDYEGISQTVKAEFEKITKSTNIMVDIKPKCPI